MGRFLIGREDAGSYLELDQCLALRRKGRFFK